MRAVKFILLGAFLGSLLLILFGFLGGSGVEFLNSRGEPTEAAVMEFIVYSIVGILLGGALGLGAHVITRVPEPEPASIDGQPGSPGATGLGRTEPAVKMNPVLVSAVGGLGLTAMSAFRIANAQPGANMPILYGLLIGAVAGSVVIVIFALRSNRTI